MSAPGLTERRLPTITSERYWLLSEIEQRVQFQFLEDKLPAEPTAASPLDVEEEAICYLLWDLATTSEADLRDLISSKILCKRLAAAPDGRFARAAAWLLAFEVLLPSGGQEWSEVCESRAKISRLHNWIFTEIGALGCDMPALVVGVSDQPAGAPALEAVLETVTERSSGAKQVLFALTRDDLLGHDAAREPDASMGVLQLLLVSPRAASLLAPCSVKKATRGINAGALNLTREVLTFIALAAALFVILLR